MTRFFNAYNKDGVPIDGRNDEVYGNFDDPCNGRWDNNDSSSQVDAAFRSAWQNGGVCGLPKDPQDLWDELARPALGQVEQTDPSGSGIGGQIDDKARPDYYHQSIDPGDATFADANAS